MRLLQGTRNFGVLRQTLKLCLGRDSKWNVLVSEDGTLRGWGPFAKRVLGVAALPLNPGTWCQTS